MKIYKRAGLLCLLGLLFAGAFGMKAQAAPFKPGVLMGENEAGEEVTLGAAVILAVDENEAYAYTSIDVYEVQAKNHVLSTRDGEYEATYYNSSEDIGIASWSVPGASWDEGGLYVKSPYEGQTADLVYLTEKGRADTKAVTVQGYRTKGSLYFLEVEGLPIEDVQYPAAILNEEDICIGVAMSSEKVWAPYLSESEFSGSLGEWEGTTGNSTGSTASDSTTDSEARESGPLISLSDSSLDLKIFSVIVIICCIVYQVNLIRKRKKQKQEMKK